MTDKKQEKSLLSQLIDASSIGIQLVVSTFAGLAIGYGLDHLFGTLPWLTFIFLIIGIIAGFRDMLRIARKANKSNGGNDEGNNNGHT
jgi:ATP synthase protein I